jgi:hypothetical protein
LVFFNDFIEVSGIGDIRKAMLGDFEFQAIGLNGMNMAEGGGELHTVNII